MVKHGVLLCSFFFRKKYKGEDEALLLNNEYEYDDVICVNAIEMVKECLESFCDYSDDTKLMKMFAVDKDSIKTDINEDRSIITATVMSGSYGIESNMTNVRTKEVVYTRTSEDADIKKFQLMIYVPKDKGDVEVSKGIMLFETIGNFGVKTITTQHINEYFSNQKGLVLITRSISVRAFLENMMHNQKLNRITLIKNSISPDNSDRIFLSAGREEKTYIKPKLTDSFISKILNFVEGKNEDDIFEVGDETFENMKLTFSFNGRSRTVNLIDIEKFSLIEDVPDSVVSADNDNKQKLISYMVELANRYAEKMVFFIE